MKTLTGAGSWLMSAYWRGAESRASLSRTCELFKNQGAPGTGNWHRNMCTLTLHDLPANLPACYVEQVNDSRAGLRQRCRLVQPSILHTRGANLGCMRKSVRASVHEVERRVAQSGPPRRQG